VAAPKAAPALRWWSAGRLSALSTTPLEAALAFGSVAALVGSVGQAPYAAANTALDACAASERARGGVASAVAWGAWRGGGMAAASGADAAERFGLGALSATQGVAALHLLLGGGGSGAATGVGLALAEGRTIATPIDWPVIMRSIAARGAAFPAFADLGAAHAGALSDSPGEAAAAAAAGKKGSTIPAKYARMHGVAAVAAVTARLVTLVTESTDLDVDVDAPLMESGLDSLAGVELQKRLEQEFNVRLEPTVRQCRTLVDPGLTPA
jgi:acyl carrier protein